VKNRFQNLPFKCNLQRYGKVFYDDANRLVIVADLATSLTVGLCRLNQVDPYPITYDLSNP
jgi:hypothetical protein